MARDDGNPDIRPEKRKAHQSPEVAEVWRKDIPRNYLKRKGYEIPGRAGMAVYVTRETRRSAKMESKAEKLGMIIKIAA